MDPALAEAARPWLVTWAVLIGAAVGSFINVVVARVPAGESIARPRSRCPGCRVPIAWYDNLPVFSWFLLRARCRRCGMRISPRYPLVELLGAGAGWLAFARHGFGLAALSEFVEVMLLLALAFIDLDTWLLPNVLTWPLIGLGLLASLAGSSAAPSLTASAIGAVAGFAAFGLVAYLGEKVFKKEALGFGDVWLLAGLGAWHGVAALLPIVLLASSQGAIVGLLLIAFGKAQPGPPEGESRGSEEDWVPPRNAVPFGPFLAVSALEWLYLSGGITSLVPALRLFR